MSLQDDLAYVLQVAQGASGVILQHFGKVERLTKSHQAATDEAVTIADRASQRYIVAELRKRFPTDGIIGEENEAGDNITFDCPDPNGRVWVIDPIDGTNNFVSGLEYFAVCIGLLEKGYPVLGVVHDVCRNRSYYAARGSGAFVNGKPIHALPTPMDDRSMVIGTANFLTERGTLPPYAVRWLGQTRWKMRCLGSAAMDAMQVASGVAHGAVTVNGKLWDVAAPAAIVLEAGGKLTDPSGKEVFPFDLRGYAGKKVPFVAAGPLALDTLLTEIADPSIPPVD